MSDRPSIRAQFLIFTLFGEYVVPRGGGAWTAGLLNLLGVLGVSERAGRSTLSRMSQKGWLRSRRNGRHSRYEITLRGQRIVEAGAVRIFEPHRVSSERHFHILPPPPPGGQPRAAPPPPPPPGRARLGPAGARPRGLAQRPPSGGQGRPRGF